MTAAGVSWQVRLGEADALTAWDFERGPVPVSELASVRFPVSHDRSRHIPVRAYSQRCGTVVRLESGLEHDLFRMVDRDPDTAWLVGQPFRLLITPPVGKRFTHVPDLLVVSTAGAVTVWDARPLERADDDFWRAADATRAACTEAGWSYRVFHGLPEVERLNLLWLHGFRRPRPWHARWAGRVLAATTTPPHPGTEGAGVPLGEVMSVDDGSGEAISTLWHLAWSGRLRIDLAQPITAATRVHGPDATAAQEAATGQDLEPGTPDQDRAAAGHETGAAARREVA